MTRDREQVESTRWRARPVAAASVRAAVLLVPTAASVAAVWLATRIVRLPSG